MGKLTSHVLNTAAGVPANGLRIDLYRKEDRAATLIKTATTNSNGRTDSPLLEGDELAAGAYRFVFHVGAYFRSMRNTDAGLFLDEVSVDFRIADPTQAYHVPLLVSPWSYSTYRGS